MRTKTQRLERVESQILRPRTELEARETLARLFPDLSDYFETASSDELAEMADAVLDRLTWR